MDSMRITVQMITDAAKTKHVRIHMETKDGLLASAIVVNAASARAVAAALVSAADLVERKLVTLDSSPVELMKQIGD